MQKYLVVFSAFHHHSRKYDDEEDCDCGERGNPNYSKVFFRWVFFTFLQSFS